MRHTRHVPGSEPGSRGGKTSEGARHPTCAGTPGPFRSADVKGAASTGVWLGLAIGGVAAQADSAAIAINADGTVRIGGTALVVTDDAVTLCNGFVTVTDEALVLRTTGGDEVAVSAAGKISALSGSFSADPSGAVALTLLNGSAFSHAADGATELRLHDGATRAMAMPGAAPTFRFPKENAVSSVSADASGTVTVPGSSCRRAECLALMPKDQTMGSVVRRHSGTRDRLPDHDTRTGGQGFVLGPPRDFTNEGQAECSAGIFGKWSPGTETVVAARAFCDGRLCETFVCYRVTPGLRSPASAVIHRQPGPAVFLDKAFFILASLLCWRSLSLPDRGRDLSRRKPRPVRSSSRRTAR